MSAVRPSLQCSRQLGSVAPTVAVRAGTSDIYKCCHVKSKIVFTCVVSLFSQDIPDDLFPKWGEKGEKELSPEENLRGG